MFFRRLIRWLADLPAPFALGLLWWAEVTVLLCAMVGAGLLSDFLFDNAKARWENWLFPIALVTYFAVFYLLHFEYTGISLLMEGLVHIHRMGGRARVETLYREAKKKQEEEKSAGIEPSTEAMDPYAPPRRIRASAGIFKLRYFIVLPTALVLYLLSFASTIYRIFARQIETWEPSYLVMPAFAMVFIGSFCYWFLMPHLPGYVSVRGLLASRSSEGE